MKEKKTIACVVLGVAFVSLISVLVAAFANSLVMFIDGNRISGVSVSDKYAIITGSITLGAVVLGIAFAVLFFVNIKRRFAVSAALMFCSRLYLLKTNQSEPPKTE